MILATLCYIKEDAKTLMLHRVKREGDIHKNKWNGLGGKIQPSETPEECVIREVGEEAGITIQNPELCGILTFPNFDGKQDWYAFVFTATEFTGRPHAECDEGRLEWIEDGKLLTLPLWEGDPIFLKWIEERKFFSAKFCYAKGKLISHDVTFHQVKEEEDHAKRKKA